MKKGGFSGDDCSFWPNWHGRGVQGRKRRPKKTSLGQNMVSVRVQPVSRGAPTRASGLCRDKCLQSLFDLTHAHFDGPGVGNDEGKWTALVCCCCCYLHKNGKNRKRMRGREGRNGKRTSSRVCTLKDPLAPQRCTMVAPPLSQAGKEQIWLMQPEETHIATPQTKALSCLVVQVCVFGLYIRCTLSPSLLQITTKHSDGKTLSFKFCK